MQSNKEENFLFTMFIVLTPIAILLFFLFQIESKNHALVGITETEETKILEKMKNPKCFEKGCKYGDFILERELKNKPINTI